MILEIALLGMLVSIWLYIIAAFIVGTEYRELVEAAYIDEETLHELHIMNEIDDNE